MLAVIVYAATWIDPSFNAKNGAVLDGLAGSVARVVAWALYAFCAGSVGTGVWVVAHECEYSQLRCPCVSSHLDRCVRQLRE